MSLQMIVIDMTQEFATAWGHQAEQLIGRYLGRVGDELGAQAGGVIKFTPSMKSMGFVSSWPGTDQGDGSRELGSYEWLMEQLNTGKGFYFSPDTWPSEAGAEKELFAQWGCASVICVPIYRNELRGFAFWGSEDTANWGMNELGGLKQVGNIFGIALDKMG
jgi:hypothetical protein